MSFKPTIIAFIKDSRAAGAIIFACTLISVLLANSAHGNYYTSLWNYKCSMSFASLHLPDTLLHFTNEVLMSVFFFSAGLEIKRELSSGELNTFQKSLMPVISATGGMLLPALIYLIFCHGKTNFMGWGIPMATDIAFSLGVLSLLGKRAPLSLRIFLTAIAIIDDIGGILTIALFYASGIHWFYLALAGIICIGLFALNYFKIMKPAYFIFAGIFLWYFVYNSGIHATIAGVILAFMMPSAAIHNLERMLHIPVNFIILPLFALANTAIVLPTNIYQAISSNEYSGIFAGLFVGKPAGIFIATWFALKMKLARLPDRITLKQIFGIGLIAGIGFTVSIFITMLAFPDPETQLTAKLAVINASVCAGLAGYCFLHFTRPKPFSPIER